MVRDVLFVVIRQMIRRSLSNIKDCSTAGSESNDPIDFTSTYRGGVVPSVIIAVGSGTVRRPSAVTAVSVDNAYVTRPPARIARRPTAQM